MCDKYKSSSNLREGSGELDRSIGFGMKKEELTKGASTSSFQVGPRYINNYTTFKKIQTNNR